MSQSYVNERTSTPNSGDIDIIGILIVLAKYKKWIVTVTIFSAILSAIVSFVLPNEYLATTKVLPPQQTQSSAAALLSQLGGIAGAAAVGAAGLKNPNDLYIGMLKSRTIADRLISRFNLLKIYQTDSLDKARKILASNTTITSGRDGLISIDVENKDKKLVAPLANAYVTELFVLMKTLAVSDASQRRLFYEREFETTKGRLAQAEMALKRNMDTRGVISVDAESRAILETVARLKAQASAKEIQLSAMGAFLTPSNPDYRRAQEELTSLRAELAKLENGRGASVANSISESGLENIKLLRELKYQQMLYEVLAKQYEVARIDEAKDPSIIQILDNAVEPEHKSKPRRAIIVFLITALAFAMASVWALIVEARRKAMMNPEGAARWEELKSHLGRTRSSH